MTVYVVQNQMRFDPVARTMVPRFTTLNKAEEFGKIEYILDPQASLFESDSAVAVMHMKLNTFSDHDHLVLVGNPGLIGLVTAIAASYNNGSVSILQWSGRHSRYIEIKSTLF